MGRDPQAGAQLLAAAFLHRAPGEIHAVGHYQVVPLVAEAAEVFTGPPAHHPHLVAGGDVVHQKADGRLLEEVAGDAVLTTRRRFPDCHVALDLSEDILFLPMEPMLIKQVIVNLLENAIRHSGDREHIRLRLFRQEDWAVVEVRDRGRGISPEVSQAVQLGRPLEDNLSGDSSRGMGIGLSVCQSIIKAHNGFFAAGNDPEGGAVFRFGLPMEEIKDE